MPGRTVMLVTVLCLAAASFVSCSSDRVAVPKEADHDVSSVEPIEYGRLHNEILREYENHTHMFRDRLSRAEAVGLFIRSTNIVFERNGIEYTVDDRFVDRMLVTFDRLEKRCGFDVFTPGSDPEPVFSYFEGLDLPESKGIDNLRSCWKGVQTPGREVQGRKPTIPDGDDPLFPVIDITEHSAEFWRDYYHRMDEYVEQHPELQGWWDKWKKRIRECALICSDCIGGLAGLGAGPAGAIAGAALGSLAFTFAWPPY